MSNIFTYRLAALISQAWCVLLNKILIQSLVFVELFKATVVRALIIIVFLSLELQPFLFDELLGFLPA